MQVILRGWLIFWAVVVAILLAAFIWLAWASNLLRDPPVVPLSGDARAAFSLARTQAAWWLFVILVSYLFVGIVTGEFLNSISGTVAVLAMLSGGTAGLGAVIGASATAGATARLSTLRQAERDAHAALDAAEAAYNANPTIDAKATLASRRSLCADAVKQREALENRLTAATKSEGPHIDILSDVNGVTVHRFQMVAWTLVLSIIFLFHVYEELAMPQFSETLLALMGISQATYLALKIPEAPTT